MTHSVRIFLGGLKVISVRILTFSTSIKGVPLTNIQTCTLCPFTRYGTNSYTKFTFCTHARTVYNTGAIIAHFIPLRIRLFQAIMALINVLTCWTARTSPTYIWGRTMGVTCTHTLEGLTRLSRDARGTIPIIIEPEVVH